MGRDLRKLTSLELSRATKQFNANFKAINGAITKATFASKLDRMQISLVSKANANKAVEALERKFDSFQKREEKLAEKGLSPLRKNEDKNGLLDLKNSFLEMTNGKLVNAIIQAKKVAMDKDLLQCQTDKEREIVRMYYFRSQLTKFGKLKVIEDYLASKGLIDTFDLSAEISEALPALEEFKGVKNEVASLENQGVITE
jgi:hypothetical protein